MLCLKPVTIDSATTITATLSAVATIASFMMKEEKAPFCFTRYRLAIKKERFIPVACNVLVLV